MTMQEIHLHHCRHCRPLTSPLLLRLFFIPPSWMKTIIMMIIAVTMAMAMAMAMAIIPRRRRRRRRRHQLPPALVIQLYHHRLFWNVFG